MTQALLTPHVKGDADQVEVPLRRRDGSVRAVVTIDAADLPLVDGFRWSLDSHGYAMRMERIGGRQRSVKMHRVIAGAGPAEEVDHRDGDPLNNTRANLRVCTHAQNQKNQKLRQDNTSGFKGVDPVPSGRWRAVIKVDGERRHLGTFDSPEEAARAYRDAARKHFGAFVREAA